MNKPIYSTVDQLCDRHSAFKPGGVRHLIFNEKINGLADSGAVVRLGRKVLINEEKFFDWLERRSNSCDVDAAEDYINRGIEILAQPVEKNLTKQEIENVYDTVIDFLRAALCRLGRKKAA